MRVPELRAEATYGAESYSYDVLFSVVQSRQRVMISLSERRRILNFKHMYCKVMQRFN